MASLTGVPYLPPIVDLPTFNVATFPEATSFADQSVLKGIYQDTVTNQVLVSSNTVKATALAKLYSYTIATVENEPPGSTVTVATIPAGIIPSGIQALVYVSINISTNLTNRTANSITVGLSGFYTQLYGQLLTGTSNLQQNLSNQFMFLITGTGNAINVTLNSATTGGGTYRLNSPNGNGNFYTNLNPSDVQVLLL
jgi:hypothetical protein